VDSGSGDVVAYQGALANGPLLAQLTVLKRLPAVTIKLTLMIVPVNGLPPRQW
jgi:hypothetical protein